MSNFFRSIATICFMVLASQAIAHGSHKTVSAGEAMDIAQQLTVQMTRENVGQRFGILPESWAAVSTEGMTVQEIEKGFYIVEAKNSATDESLFLLVAKNGEVYDANFSGRFEGLN